MSALTWAGSLMRWRWHCCVMTSVSLWGGCVRVSRLKAKAMKLRGCPWWQVGGWGVAGAVRAGVAEGGGQGLRQGGGAGERCRVEVGGCVAAWHVVGGG